MAVVCADKRNINSLASYPEQHSNWSLQPISSWTLDRHKIIPSPVYVALLKGAIVAAVSVSALRNGRTHQQHILIYSSVQYRIRHWSSAILPTAAVVWPNCRNSRADYTVKC